MLTLTRSFTYLLFLFFISSPVFADELFTARIDRPEIYQDETVELTFTINTGGAGPLIFEPETNDYAVVAQSSSANIRIINGVKSQTQTVSLVIKFKQPGKITLPAAKIEIQGITHSSSPITVNVLPDPQKSAPPAQQQYPSSKPQAKPKQELKADPKKSLDDKVFARLELSDSQPHVNEQVQMALKIYHGGNLRKIDLPSFSFDNFLQERINKGIESTETYEGKQYFTYTIDHVLFPVTPGRSYIEPQEISVSVMDTEAVRNRPFDPFQTLMNFSLEKNVKLKTNAVSINVQDLPAGAPDDFTGYVGDIIVKHELNKQEVMEGDAITVDTEIYGNGNKNSLDLEIIKESRQYNIFNDKNSSEDTIDKKLKVFKTNAKKAVIPRRPGHLAIQIKPLVIFNPRTKKYEEHGGKTLYVDVMPNPDKKNRIANELEQEKEQQEKIEAVKEIMVISQERIEKGGPKQIPEWLMLVLLVLVNIFLVLKPLLSPLQQISSIKIVDKQGFGKIEKEIKKAQSVEELSIKFQEINKLINETKVDEEFKNKISKFIGKTERLLYSGGAAAENLDDLKSESLELLKEVKRKYA